MTQTTRHRHFSPVEMLERCLARIDRCESQVRAWALIDHDRARAEAEARADELRRGIDRGPLHGVPVGIKDIIDVFDWPTACGSARWKDAIARQDAPVVRRLREAGAVLIGKTVTTAYASFDPPPTRNPYHLARTPGGSSSGSAAAVACGMCWGALGSQTGGSITRPASYCGVAACKPTYGFAPLEGVLPLAPSMDHVGAMAGSVEQVAQLMGVLRGTPAPHDTPLRAGGPPTLARLRGLFERLAAPEVTACLDQMGDFLRTKGATILEIDLPAAFEEVLARHRIVMAVEAARYHEERLARHPDDYGPCIRQLLEEGIACPAPEYSRTKEHQLRLTAEMDALLRDTILLAPATTTPAPDAATTGDPAFNSPWSYTGLPVVSFPIGRDADGLPLGAQLIGRAWSEPRLFAAAWWCEKNLGFSLGEPAIVMG